MFRVLRIFSPIFLAIAAVAGGAISVSAECRRSGTSSVLEFSDAAPLVSGATIGSIVSTIDAVNASSLAQVTAYGGAPATARPGQEGGGAWGRLIGGNVETSANTSASGTATDAPRGQSYSGTSNCLSIARLDFTGAQAGIDVGRFNLDGGAFLLLGISAGYFDVKAQDKTPGLGQFGADVSIPFVGGYLGYLHGNFRIDAQLRGDYMTLSMSDVDQGMSRQPVTARGLALLANASYRFDLPDNWFFETSAGAVGSRTRVDSFGVSGGLFVPAQFTPSASLPANIQVDAIESLLGRASLRVGTTVVTDQLTLSPFLTASVFREFAGAVRTHASTLDRHYLINTELITDRVGTYGHIGIGVAGLLLNTNWQGYVRADYRFGERTEGLSYNIGLRQQLDTQKPVSERADADRRPHDFSGLYAGLFTGSLWGNQDWSYVGFDREKQTYMQGYVIGGRLGYTHQQGSFVVGAEIDYGRSNAEGGSACPNANYFSCSTRLENLTSIAGRIGFVQDRALFFAKAGLAAAKVTAETRFNLDAWRTDASGGGSGTTASGWLAGAGMEIALSPNWSMLGEYSRIKLGERQFSIDNGLAVRAPTLAQIVRIGINYHFNQ